MNAVLNLPIVLIEFFIAIWLIVKGVNVSTAANVGDDISNSF